MPQGLDELSIDEIRERFIEKETGIGAGIEPVAA